MRPGRVAGFTLIELMIVVMIIGILAAIAIPNFIAMETRAKEGNTRANMHTFQLTAEDYAVQNEATYADLAADVASLIPGLGAEFRNPFDRTIGSGNSWVDQATWTVPLASGSTHAGVVAYGDSSGIKYQIVGRGKNGDLNLVLSTGQ